MRDVNYKYKVTSKKIKNKVNYTYVRLSWDIHSGSDITRSGSDFKYLLI